MYKPHFFGEILAQNHGCSLSTRPLHANRAGCSGVAEWVNIKLLTSASFASSGLFLHIKLKNCSILVTKQLFTILINKNNKETDHFEKVFSLKTVMKTTLFVCEQFSTSRHSTCLLAMSLDTSSSFRMSAWLQSYERFHKQNNHMSVLHAKFDAKTVMNEEIPIKEWQKKIKKCQSLAEMNVYSIMF